MRHLWLALWLVALGWDGLAPHIEQVSPRMATVAFVAASLLLIRRGRTAPHFGALLSGVLAAAMILTAMVLPWPEQLGPLILAAALVASMVPWLGRVSDGNSWRVPAALGAMITLNAALSHLYRYVEASQHDLNVMAWPVAFLMRLFGAPAVADPPFVYVQGVGNVHAFDCTVEKVIGHGLALFAIGGFGMLAAVRGARLGNRAPSMLILLTALFVLARTVLLGLALDDVTQLQIFYSRVWIFGTLLPLVALLALVVPPLPPELATAHHTKPLGISGLLTRRAAALLVTCAVVGSLAAGALGFFDPGRAKAGRVLIDENHSNWEWTTVDLNTESYGVQTVYNYSELVRYLEHFYDVTTNFAPFTDSLLAETDVLILKTPTRPYDPEEIEVVARFVERGGGLWLIGDHTNIFGMSSNLNRLASRFGIRYHYDAVIGLLTGGRQLYQRPRRFAHPSIRHLPPILMATSASMSGPPLGHRVMLGRSLLSDRLDYSVNSFFGNFSPDANESFGSMLQTVGVVHGRGRVLGFSDSTVFSNFFMFIRGKPELALGSVNWLMHQNRWPWIRLALLIAALAGTVVLVGLASALPRNVVTASVLLAGVPTFALAALGLDTWVGRWSRLPEPRTPLPIVAFDRGRTAYQIPDIAELPDDSPFSFHTFYVWTQRVGYVPTTRLFERCTDGSDIVVLINPRAHFHLEEVVQLEDYVRNGGGLLVMDSPKAAHSSANALLNRFDMAFEYAEAETTAVYDAVTGDSLAMLPHVGRVVGGEPIAILPDSSTALSLAEFGEGRVVAMCASDSFSDAILGTTSDIPNHEQLGLYRLEFRIFDELLRDR